MSSIIGNVKSIADRWSVANIGLIRQGSIYFMIVFLILIGGVFSPGFVSANNISNILRQSAALGIVAVGQTVVMIAAGFDLSVTAVMQLVTVMIAEFSQGRDELVLPAFVACMVLGLVVGLFNGIIVAKRRASAFMVTLATALIVTGIRLLYTGAKPSGILPDGLRPLSQGQVMGLPFSLILYLIITFLAWLLLRKTVYGRRLYATGGNREAARLSGVPVVSVEIIAYVISGLTAAFGGLVLAAYVGFIDQWIAGGYELDSIAAAAIGGVSLAGGAGSVWGTFAGVILIRMLMNFVLVMGLPIEYQFIVRGGVVVLAVAIYNIRLTKIPSFRRKEAETAN